MPAYRPEIDGLRSLAVVPVVLFHAGLPPFTGGYVGVDVFFVISGYLITSILIEEMRTDRFTIAGFYERRARRILPALFFVMLVCLPFGWNWLLVREFKEFLQSVAAATLSLSNFLFWLKSGYFAQDAELLPLLHTWSLGVEEQFYILFPGLLLLLRRWSPIRQATALVGVAIASFAAGVFYIGDDPMMVYFLLPFRAWELMIGAFCAFAHLNYRRQRSELAALAGVGLVLWAMVAYDAATVFPGWAALLPVVGTALIILFTDPGTLVGRVLSRRPIVFLGLISYSLYLWHQPVLAFARHYSPDPLPTVAIFALIALSVGLAVLSWRYVEMPFRRRGAGALVPQRGQVFALSLAGIVTLTAIGVSGDVMRGFPGRLNAEETRVANDNGWSSACMYTRADPPPGLPDPACITNPGQDRKVALIGDSVMSSLSPAFSALFASQGYEVHQITHSHCTLNTAFQRKSHNADPCPDFTRAALDFVRQEDFDLVVHAGNLVPFFSGDPGEMVRADTGAPTQDVEAALADFTTNANMLPGRFILVLPHQTTPVDIRQRALKQLRITGEMEDFAVKRSGPDGQAQRVSERLRAAGGDRWLFLNPDDSLCDAETCHFVSDGQIRLSDTLHFTAEGARLVSGQLETLLKREGLLTSDQSIRHIR